MIGFVILTQNLQQNIYFPHHPCSSLFSHRNLKWHKGLRFSKEKLLYLLLSSPSPVFFLFYFFFPSTVREYLKTLTLTNSLTSLNFYGELGTAEINGKPLLQFLKVWFFTQGICQEISVVVWTLLEGVIPAGRISCNRAEDHFYGNGFGVTQRINTPHGLKSLCPDIQRMVFAATAISQLETGVPRLAPTAQLLSFFTF